MNTPTPEGRATVLTPERRRVILAAIAAGASYATAALAAGASRRSMTRWLADGRTLNDQLIADGDDPDTYSETNPPPGFTDNQVSYWLLWRETERATALSEVEALRIIRDASLGSPVTKERTVTHADGTTERTVETTVTRHWTAAAWMLERRLPERYARRTVVTGEGGGPVEVEVDVDEKRRRLREALDARSEELGIPAAGNRPGLN